MFGSFTVSFDSTVTNFGSLPSFTSNLNFPRPYNFIFRPGQNFGELGAGHCDMVGCSAGAGNDNVVVDIFGAATANPFINELFYSTDIVDHTGVFLLLQPHSALRNLFLSQAHYLFYTPVSRA